ncbi:MAG TPA: DUF2799 domain-containing protein [Limnobacter sp.]|nr:DUF2799 domain-containing protein [Limnobacter sp.]
MSVSACRLGWFAAAILLQAMLSGCATMSKEECLVANWREVGFTDASQGYTQARIAEHRSACAEAKVTVNLEEYNKGFEQGLKNYCTASTGFDLGARGAAYPDQCAEKTYPKVRAGFREGQAVYAVQRERNEVERELQDKREQSKALTEQITVNRNRADNKTLSSAERSKAEKTVSALQRTAADLFRETGELEQRAKQLDNKMNQMRASYNTRQ